MNEVQELKEKMQEMHNMIEYCLYGCECLMKDRSVTLPRQLLAAFCHMVLRVIRFIHTKIQNRIEELDSEEEKNIGE